MKIADGLTASSAALKSGDITFNKEDGKGSYVAKPEAPSVKEYKDTLTGFDLIDEAYVDVIKDGVYKICSGYQNYQPIWHGHCRKCPD